MRNARDNRIWVAVRVQRGFVSDVRAYGDEKRARQQENLWRRQMNLDYDETCVSRVRLVAKGRQGKPVRSGRSS